MIQNLIIYLTFLGITNILEHHRRHILIFPKVMSLQNIPAPGLPEKGHDQDPCVST
jgi:hypothetical protein